MPGIEKDSFPLHSVQTGSEAHPASFLFPGSKAAGREADNLPPSTDKEQYV